MDNQPSIQNIQQQDNQNKILFIILGIIGVVIIALVLCIFFLVPNLKKSQNKDLLRQADQLYSQENDCYGIVKILGNIDELMLGDEEKISYYRYLFVCYDALGDEQKSTIYYSKLFDIMDKQNLMSGG